MNASAQHVQRLVTLSRACALAVFALGLAVVAGWVFDIPLLTSVLPGLVAMKVNTALAFMLSGLALGLKSAGSKPDARLPADALLPPAGSKGRNRKAVAANVCATLVALIGAVTLCEYLGGWDWGVENWLVKEGPNAVLTLHPGRMAPNTALCFVWFGLALLLLDVETRRGARPAQYLALAAGLVALLALTGYVYGISTFYAGVGRYTAMALHTTLAFLALSHGVFLARPERGLASLLASEGLAGTTLRRLLPVAIATPVLLGWAVRAAERTELFTGAFGDALAALGCSVIVAATVWANALALARAAAKRQAAERRYRTLFESTADAVMTLDADHFLDCNGATLRMFGCATQAEFIALHPADVSPPCQADGLDSKTAADRRIATAFARKVHQFEWLHRRRNGEDFPADVLLTAFQTDGGQILQATVRDITERKRAEERDRLLALQLRQRQKMEAVGALASGAAHEINNPITGIINYAQLIADRPDAAGPVREYAGEIVHEGERVAAIVRHMLSFAQRQTETHSPAALADIVHAVLPLAEATWRGDQIALTVDLPEELPAIECRSQQLQQVLMNLLNNARDALNERYAGYAPDKVVLLSARAHRQDGKHRLAVTVEDHGRGIAPEFRERIFDPFFTTKSRTEHSGLGLAVAQAIIRDHGGELTVESEPDRYTRFTFELPAAEPRRGGET